MQCDCSKPSRSGLREIGPKVNINQACPQIVETINQGERKVQYSLNKILLHFCLFSIFRETLLEAYEGINHFNALKALRNSENK